LPSLVFVTAYDTYAVEAFEVSAVDYLLKPFDQDRFRRTLERVRPRHATSGMDERRRFSPVCLRNWTHRSAARRRAAPAAGGIRRPPARARRAQVEMIEADRNYVVIRVGKDSFHARSTLQQAELALRSNPCCASAAPAS